jgi:peptide/histidine transporter 3/4
MDPIEEKPKKSNERTVVWTDSTGETHYYYENPLMKVCSFILIQEMCERLAFYGIVPTLKPFLRKVYKFPDDGLNSFVMLFNGISFLCAFISAIIADTVLGIYKTIIVFSGVYMAGLALLCVAAIDSVQQLWMVYLALFGLLAVGAGGIKSCVSVLGGQQYSPVDQKEKLTTFFTLFYASINVGALIGGFVVPLVIKETGDNYFAGYLIPAVAFAIATAVIIMGSKRYVLLKPQGSAVLEIIRVCFSGLGKFSLNACRKSQGGEFEDYFIDDAKSLFSLVPFFAMVIPFNITYYQIFSGFESQSEQMDSYVFGWKMPHEWMVNIDPISVILGSLVVDKYIYPALRKKNKMPSIMVRFFIGYCFGVLANLCAMGVEMYCNSVGHGSVSIWLQVPQFAFVAFGEIFIFSTSYEVAFTKSPEPLKAVASAFNLVGFAIAGFTGSALIQACKGWTAFGHYDYYFALFSGICVLFAVLSLLLNRHFNGVFQRAEEHQKNAMTRFQGAVKSDEPGADITVLA